jgi:cyclohexanecarboxylate-CoA ligase
VGGSTPGRLATGAVSYRGAGLWSDRTVGSHLLEAAGDLPSKTAIVDGSSRVDYGSLAAAAGRLQRALRRDGVAAGDVVSYQLPNWQETAAIHHAVTGLGAVNNPLMPIYRRHELRFILHQAKPAALFIPHRFRGTDYVAMFAELIAAGEADLLPIVVRAEPPLPAGFRSLEEFVAGGEGGELVDEARPEAPTLLLYTSGTTSDPKGALHTHQSLVYENRSMIDWLGLTPEDVVYMGSPLTHITGFLYGIQLPPMLRTHAVYQPVWDPAEAVDLIEAEKATFSVAATPFLNGLVREYERRGTAASLRVFACGGADVPPDLVLRGRQVMDAAVVRVYGSTEFPTFSCSRPEDPPAKAANTDGRPIGPVRFRVVDEASGEVEAGAAGELMVAGPDCFAGYLDGSLNAEAFTADGFFRTGDLASVDRDGFITIHGRLKDIIIRNGENISAKEVEDLLYQHPAVREVAVVAMPDPETGEKACAYVVVEDGAEFGFAAMTAHLAARQVARQKFPERLETWPGELPKTASGKIQKFKLRADVRAKLDATVAGG